MQKSNYRISLDIQNTHTPMQLDMKRGDTGRRVCITLTDGGKPYRIDADCHAVFTARRPETDPIYTQCAVQENTIIYDITPQTTAVAGRLCCEIKLYGSDNMLLTSAAFAIAVHDTVYNEGEQIASGEELDAFSQLMLQGYALVDQVQQKLDKGEFQGEKGDKGDPGEVNVDDAAVGADAWSSKNIVDKLCPPFEETGAVVTCEPVEGYPLGVVSSIQPTQEGSGDPSPDNIRPITGHTAVTMTHNSETFTVNLGQTVYGGSLDWNTGVLTVQWGCNKVKDFTDWTVYLGHIFGTWGLRGKGVFVKDNMSRPIGLCSHYRGDSAGNIYTTSGSIHDYVYCFGLNNTARLGIADKRFSTVEDFVANMGECQILYQLVDPVTIQLTPREILALSGTNCLYSNTGDTQVSGRSDPAIVIDKITNAIIALGGNI